MPLSKAAILALKGTDHEAKKRIAEKLDVQPSTIYRWIRDEHENLTLANTIEAIMPEIGMDRDQILERATIGDVTTVAK